jgi:hypothetical protein
MGTCRGSGVLVRREGEWKIAHYNLAVTVPNDLIDEYIGLFNKKAGGAKGTDEDKGNDQKGSE